MEKDGEKKPAHFGAGFDDLYLTDFCYYYLALLILHCVSVRSLDT